MLVASYAPATKDMHAAAAFSRRKKDGAVVVRLDCLKSVLPDCYIFKRPLRVEPSSLAVFSAVLVMT